MAQSFRDELAALRSMFPTWDVEVLEELLEAHQGSLESTVDSLLSMDVVPGDQVAQPPPAPAQAPRSPPRRSRSPTAAASSSPSGHSRICRVKLPDDFLRLPTDEFRELSELEERDAILARMLQDQFFRDEVLSSEEFSSHFHDRSARQSQAYPPEKTAAEIASETYTVMSEKLTSMSEVMKSKMHEMYMRFQMRNDAPASRDPKSQRPLMEDDSDSSDDEDLNDNSDVRRRNMDQRRSQGSPRRGSPRNLTRRPNAGAGVISKKDD
ncbi:hypothetical protein PHYPSEUDO_009460 [Phytophthora pseudosyringae]|uniref:CUE domain-containing protein n=1 Tax=Phytophthora pseudosyringae TaxID=221518 RepID=A0A8T1VCP3_9STRA|nr:hypothetical protein PHYPSEUDO_009460 [Phytophthora pseudosyringae]